MHSTSLSRRLLPFVALATALSLDAATVTLRLGTILPKGTAQGNLLELMNQEWQRDSAGGVRLQVYWNGAQGGEAEMVKKMRIGQLQGALISAIGLADIDRSVTGLQLMPLVFRSWDEVDHVRKKIDDKLEERLRAKGFEVLFWADAGWVRFFSKEPAITPDDFRKTKMFVWSGDQPQIAIMNSIGVRPVPLETTDILLGLNTRMIDSVPMPPIYALAGQVYSAAPHMLEMNWVPIVGAAVVRREAWEKIPADQRQRLRRSAEETGRKIRERGRLESEEAVQAMQKRGLTVHHLTPEAEAAWKQLAEELYPRLRGDRVPEDIFDEVRRTLDDYRARPHPAGS